MFLSYRSRCYLRSIAGVSCLSSSFCLGSGHDFGSDSSSETFWIFSYSVTPTCQSRLSCHVASDRNQNK